MRVAVISNVTVSVLANLLADRHSVWVPSGHGAWMTTALEPPRELLEFAPELICLLIERRHGQVDGDVEVARAALTRQLPGVPVVVPRVEALADDLGPSFYDERMWKLAAMPFSLTGLRALQGLFEIHKVLALDLDRTLWDGVIGEDGVEHIAPKVDFQRQVRELRERGILLVAVSRNNPADVEPVWSDPRMVLRRDDFVALSINWEDKADNLRRLAETLNLGLDAFVFVDDNPAERAAVRAALPMVAVTEFPPRLEDYFPARVVTDEDRTRTEQYQAESRRRELAATMSVDEYLKSLEIRVEVHPVRPEEIARVAQLSQKSNQFNVLTRRLTENEVAACAADPSRLLLTVHAGDRFGDQGLVAFVQVDVKGTTAEFRNWVMSCRTMNRRLEYTVERRLERLLAERGVEVLRGEWRRTARNEPVRELFDRFGFALTAADDELRRYERRLSPESSGGEGA